MRNPSDDDFRYLGLNEHQIAQMIGHTVATREVVYHEALRLLMENDYRYDDMIEELPI